MAKTKKISVFDTKAYKAKLKHRKKANEYSNKYMQMQKIEKNIHKVTNTKTNNITYSLSIQVCSKIFSKTYKTLEEAIESRKKYTRTKINSSGSYNIIKHNITECINIYNEKKYKVRVNIGKNAVIKYFKTIDEAVIYRDILIKKKQLVKRITTKKKTSNMNLLYKKTNMKRKTISKNIVQTYNKKTNIILFEFAKITKGIFFCKTFKTLNEAIEYRNNYLKGQV